MKRFGAQAEVDVIIEAMHAFGFNGQLEVRRVTIGCSNRVYHVKHVDNLQSYAVHVYTTLYEQLLDNQIAIESQLAKSNLNIPILVRNDSGVPFYTTGDMVVTVSPWLKGKHPSAHDISASTCRMLGVSLATLHSSLSRLPHVNNSQLLVRDVAGWWAANHALCAIDSAKRLWDVAEQLEDATLPIGIVHGDFHRYNILIDNGNVSVLDFERSGEGVLLFDVARASIDLCSTKHTFNKRKSDAFLDGYKKVCLLTKTEQSLYRAAVAYAALAVANWFHGQKNQEMTEHFMRVGCSATEVLSTI